MKSWPADQVERRAVAGLIPYARNARTHSDAQVAQIAGSIQEWGWTIPVLVDESGGIIAGHGRVLAALLLGLEEVPVMVARGWSETQKRAYVLADNKLAQNADWDLELLRVEVSELAALDVSLDLVGFGADEVAELLAEPKTEGKTDPDAVPPAPGKPTSLTGDVWLLGRHRVMCGDCTNLESVKRLTAGETADVILTDPPYCSGGFQEAGKAAGSIGTKQGATIINDRLSTRGYLALMRAALQAMRAPILYCFTDWRMWINLFDVAESNGFGVRSMIVWNKGTPGMGRGWRSQHEIIMLGAQDAIPFEPKKSQGNVVTCKRQANELHPTQKPVELLETIIATTDFASTFYDPFGGSGSTLIACETSGKTAWLLELSGGFVDVIVMRWQGFTGLEATLEGDGRTFAEIEQERRDGHSRPTAKVQQAAGA
jgi:DNA modification methylase